jgi:hypothetical protein
LTPQERIRIAKSLFKKAKALPGLTQAQRKEARRHGWNLMAINLMEAKRNQENPTPPSAMSDRQYLVLPQNNMPLNRLAHHWLMKARTTEAQPHYLHLLSLASWGLDQRVEGEWPEENLYALQEQVNLLFGWKAEDVLEWLTENPDGPESDDQEANLLNDLKTANGPEQAAALVLSTIYSRQKSENSAL